jgi:hypothetical protein
VAPFVLEVIGYDDVWQANVGTASLKLPRADLDTGRLALAARGDGQILELRVNPIDAYRFEFRTSRYVDFKAHIASWPGKLDELPDMAPPTSTLTQLLATTVLPDIMSRGADVQRRQSVFDRWTAALAIALRRDVGGLGVSVRRAGAGAELLLIESPEPLRISDDVSLQMIRVDGGGATTQIPLAILTDGVEQRALLVPLSASGEPVVLSQGSFEIAWSIQRDRFRGATGDADSRFAQQATMRLTI